MNTSAAALVRQALFFAQGVLFALAISGIMGLYVPHPVALGAGAALGLCGLVYMILVARSGETGLRKGFFMLTGAAAAGIPLGAILYNVLAALGSFVFGVVFFFLALMVFPVLFVGGWFGSLVLLGTAGQPVSKQRKRAAWGVAGLAVIALAVALGMRVDGEGYSVTSEVVRAPAQEIGRLFVTADVDEALTPVFSHAFRHSLVSAFESNGIETVTDGFPGENDQPGTGPGFTSAEADAVMSITVKPLYRTHRDGYEAVVGTVFEATLVDAATGEDAWRLSGQVDYVGNQFFRQHGFEAHEGMIREFAWHTTAAIVRTFMIDVAGRESAPIYTDTEARQRHGQRTD